MSHDHPPGGYKLILVPVENIRTHSPAGWLPEYVTVSQDVLYEVAADVGADRKITMSRVFFEENVEVAG